MSRLVRGIVGAGVALLLGSCAPLGQERLAIELFVQGTARRTLTVGSARFALERAELAFGPAYFCATESAETELCEAALAELTHAVRIDGLSAARTRKATLEGVSGSVRSAFYDYGLTWLLTESVPRALPGAPGAFSARLRGTVERGGQRLRFAADMELWPSSPGDAAVNGVRTEHILAGDDELTVTVDPLAWLRAIDVDALFALDADGDGRVELVPGSEPYEAILLGMQNGSPASFVWGASR